MKHLIPVQECPENFGSASENSAYGIVFWQKTGLFRHCNALGFQSIISLIQKQFSPTSVQMQKMTCSLQFQHQEKNVILLTLQKEQHSNHLYIYGESPTVHAGAEFHLFALHVVSYVAKQIGSKFYVKDATGYLSHCSEEQLRASIANMTKNAVSPIE